MILKFHDHAVRRMQERMISVDEVKSVIGSPDGKVRQSRDKWILYKQIQVRKDNLIAAVVVDHSFEGVIEVITVLINFEVKK